MTIGIIEFVLFVLAWVVANVLLDLIRANLRKRAQLKLIDEIYLKVSKLVIGSLRDLNEVSKNVEM